jgi:hypothetical protein
MTFQRHLFGLLVAVVVSAGAAGPLLAGGGIGGTGIVFGPITAFGSIFVNGIEFSTDGAEILIEGRPSRESDLRLGMLVTVSGSVNADGVSGQAVAVRYCDEVEGPLTENHVGADGIGRLRVLEQIVDVGPATVFDAGTTGVADIRAIPVNALVEVSGYSQGTGLIYATRIEVKERIWQGGKIEVKGIIQDLGIDTFRIGELTVSWAEAVLLPNVPMANGLYVEVHGSRGFDAQGRLIAEHVEREGHGIVGVSGEGDRVEVHGIVTSALANGIFHINGQPVEIKPDTRFDDGTAADLVVGAEVEAEGTMVNGVLVADEVEIEGRSRGRADSDADPQGPETLGRPVADEASPPPAVTQET